MSSRAEPLQLLQQAVLFKGVNAIISVTNGNGTSQNIVTPDLTLVANNITESVFPELKFVTNHSSVGGYMRISDIKVFVNGYAYPEDVSSLLLTILDAQYISIDFETTKPTFQPFYNGIYFGPDNFQPIGNVVDSLTGGATTGLAKTFSLTMKYVYESHY